jgi:hypothetical protein
MNEREFYELCYDQYKHEQNQTDAIYQRAGILLTSLPILGAAAYKLGRPELLPQCLTDLAVFLHLLGAAGAFGCLAVSGVFLVISICPRSYQSLPPMAEWDAWRQKYREDLSKEGKEPDGEVLGNECLKLLTEKVVAAQSDYSRKNEIRRTSFQAAIISASIAMGAITVEGLFHLLLYYKGI